MTIHDNNANQICYVTIVFSSCLTVTYWSIIQKFINQQILNSRLRKEMDTTQQWWTRPPMLGLGQDHDLQDPSQIQNQDFKTSLWSAESLMEAILS